MMKKLNMVSVALATVVLVVGCSTSSKKDFVAVDDGYGSSILQQVIRKAERKAKLEGHELFTESYLGEVEETDFFLKQLKLKIDKGDMKSDPENFLKRQLRNAYRKLSLDDQELVSYEVRGKGKNIEGLAVFRAKVLRVEDDDKPSNALYAYIIVDLTTQAFVHSLALNKEGLGKYEWSVHCGGSMGPKVLYKAMGHPSDVRIDDTLHEYESRIFGDLPSIK